MALKDHGVIEDIRPAKAGWVFIQPFAGEEWRIPAKGEAKSGKELVELVQSFRVSNGLPIGDPEFEIAKYIKLASPANDRWRGNNPGQPRFRQVTPLIHEIRHSIEETAIQRPRLVIPTEAIERGAICLKCKHNVKWQTSCGECNEIVRYKGELLRQTNKLEMDEGLRACRLHKLYLPAAVFLDRDFTPPRHTEAPSDCWITAK